MSSWVLKMSLEDNFAELIATDSSLAPLPLLTREWYLRLLSPGEVVVVAGTGEAMP
jgi:hypothetical protein